MTTGATFEVASELLPEEDVTPEILLVDTDESSRAALHDVIGPLAKIVDASTGEEALRIAGTRELAAILLDVSLPGLDGFQTVTHLRRNKLARNVPVLFISEAAPDWLAVRRGYTLGALGYMIKPVDGHALRAKLEVLLTLYRRGVELRRRDELISKQHEEILHAQAALEQVSAANQAKDLYMGILGHDLRNPLGAILMSARMLLMRGTLTVEDRTSVSRIGRNAERMAALIRDILDYTRGQAIGTLPIVPKPTNMGEICAAMVDEVSLLHAERRILLEEHGELRGIWDRERVEQVISNLLTNALTHGTGEIHLLVDGRSNTEVIVCVHNAGSIPPEQIPTLFEPFRRGSASNLGLGLGLYIVQEIMKTHGGSVTVESNNEVGTKFETRWPRHASEATTP